MGLRALRHQRRSCDHFFWVLFFTILVVPEQWRCSAGLTDLHILPHEQLHKGRGEDQAARRSEVTEQRAYLALILEDQRRRSVSNEIG